MDSYSHNRDAWNRAVGEGLQWTQPISPDVVARARAGDWSVRLTPTKSVPREWFGDLSGKDVLGLASGGGQQCPTFAAAGARVTSFDASDAQLAQDALVASREGLSIRTVQGNMRDLSVFPDKSFDLVFNPCSTCFVDDVASVWRECARVLRPGGALLTGFTNPWVYLFGEEQVDRGELVVVRSIPARVHQADGMLEFSHTLEEQIGGQLRAGFQLVAMFEDDWSVWPGFVGKANPFIATRAILPL